MYMYIYEHTDTHAHTAGEGSEREMGARVDTEWTQSGHRVMRAIEGV
jgi:hypothetical protein